MIANLLPLDVSDSVAHCEFPLAGSRVFTCFGCCGGREFGVSGGEPADTGVGEFTDDERGFIVVKVVGRVVAAGV
jgi:hypothetical protein